MQEELTLTWQTIVLLASAQHLHGAACHSDYQLSFIYQSIPIPKEQTLLFVKDPFQKVLSKV